MAEIRSYPFRSHLRSDPTTWVQHQHNGKVRRDGAGQSFWFQPRTAALAEVPLDDREQTVLFRARTRDFQEVLRRKTGYSIYLDGLKERYMQYIEDIETRETR